MRFNRAPHPCQALAPFCLTRQLYIHADLATRAAIFLLPILAFVACVHFRLQPFRCILPRRRQEKGKVSDSIIEARRKCARIKRAIPGEREGLSPCQTLLRLQRGKVSLSPSCEWQRMNEFQNHITNRPMITYLPVNCGYEFAVVHRLSRLDIQAPLSCLSWSRSRLPENRTPIKQKRPASSARRHTTSTNCS